MVLSSGSERACAAILPANVEISYATVNGQVAGNVHVFNLGSRYALLSELYSTATLESKNDVE